MKKLTLILPLIFCLILAGCASSFNIVGMWVDTDGTTRTFSSNGMCLNVATIDIGGSYPTYTISEEPGSNGYYLLYVQQGGYNQTTFYVEVVNNDSIKIYDSLNSSVPIYNLTRQ